MGWADCGTDSKGRRIGYAFVAKCDHKGCKRKIDRGLSYACGGMHGTGSGFQCEGYFCHRHLRSVTHPELHMEQQCFACNEEMLAAMRTYPTDFSKEELEDALGAEYYERVDKIAVEVPSTL